MKQTPEFFRRSLQIEFESFDAFRLMKNTDHLNEANLSEAKDLLGMIDPQIIDSSLRSE